MSVFNHLCHILCVNIYIYVCVCGCVCSYFQAYAAMLLLHKYMLTFQYIKSDFFFIFSSKMHIPALYWQHPPGGSTSTEIAKRDFRFLKHNLSGVELSFFFKDVLKKTLKDRIHSKLDLFIYFSMENRVKFLHLGVISGVSWQKRRYRNVLIKERMKARHAIPDVL